MCPPKHIYYYFLVFLKKNTWNAALVDFCRNAAIPRASRTPLSARVTTLPLHEEKAALCHRCAMAATAEAILCRMLDRCCAAACQPVGNSKPEYCKFYLGSAWPPCSILCHCCVIEAISIVNLISCLVESLRLRFRDCAPERGLKHILQQILLDA